jgi:flagellar biosynthetic protein FliR
MEDWIAILFPFVVLLTRISAFMIVAPIFSSPSIPMRVKASFVLLLTIFFAMVMPPQVPAGQTDIAFVAIVLVQEALCGGALGLAARLVYSGVQQGGRMAGRQMGMMMAQVMDPTTGERSQPVGVLIDFVFMILFLNAGGHHLLLRLLAGSYRAFPVGAGPNVAILTEGIVTAGSTMLLMALKLAAPVLAAFMFLGVLLAVMARVLPEMNILMASLPLRVGLGFFMAAAILPLLEGFVAEVLTFLQQMTIR